MARKLIAVAALVALVSLASAGAALAATYNLANQSTSIIWQEVYNTLMPGSQNSTFAATHPILEWNIWSSNWAIARMKNTVAAVDTNPDPLKMTFTVEYDALKGDGIWGLGDNTRFYMQKYVNESGIDTPLIIESYNLKIRTTATYNYETEGDSWKCEPGETFYAWGTTPTDIPFVLTGILIEDYYNSSRHEGKIIQDLKLIYPYEASAVPLPAGVWLLGTGLLGLACLGRRRRQ